MQIVDMYDKWILVIQTKPEEEPQKIQFYTGAGMNHKEGVFRSYVWDECIRFGSKKVAEEQRDFLKKFHPELDIGILRIRQSLIDDYAGEFLGRAVPESSQRDQDHWRTDLQTKNKEK